MAKGWLQDDEMMTSFLIWGGESDNLILWVWSDDEEEDVGVGGSDHYCPVGSPWWHDISKEMRR